MVKIVTDSSSDISQDIAQRLGITVVPMHVHFGQESYRDRIDITPAEFFAKLKASKVFPTTAAPGVGQFAEAYDRLANETDEVLVITISSKYSATYEAAIEGKELRKRKDCRVEVIDSLTTIGGLGLLTIIAAKLSQTEASLDKVTNMVKDSISKVHAYFSTDTLEYLHRGGRIGTAKAFLGSLLHLQPIVGIVDGYTKGIAQPRSRAKVLNWFHNYISKFSGRIREVAVEYSANLEEAKVFRNRLGSLHPEENIYLLTFGPTTGTHVGPRGIGVSLIEE
jgi:DegV family protein with EDD domain